MKKWLGVMLIVTFAAGAVFAGSPGQSKMKDHHPIWGKEEALLERELDAVLAAEESSVLGELTVGEAQDLLGDISIAYQKAAYVSKSRAMSFILPGLGQFMNDDPGMGALFLSLDVVTGVGTILGAYFLLPDEVQFDELNYFNDSFSDIETAWKRRSFKDFLPTLCVLAGEGLIQAILRGISSEHAANLAEQRIAAGEITFEPKLSVLPGGAGAMGFGMGMKY
jgi:TM2 domain-containing membrane protein YozV